MNKTRNYHLTLDFGWDADADEEDSLGVWDDDGELCLEAQAWTAKPEAVLAGEAGSDHIRGYFLACDIGDIAGKATIAVIDEKGSILTGTAARDYINARIPLCRT